MQRCKAITANERGWQETDYWQCWLIWVSTVRAEAGRDDCIRAHEASSPSQSNTTLSVATKHPTLSNLCMIMYCHLKQKSPLGASHSYVKRQFSLQIDRAMVLHPTRHKNKSFQISPSSQSLRTVLKKTNLTKQKQTSINKLKKL